MLYLSEKDFSKHIETWLHLIDFATDWCEPCKKLESLFPNLQETYKDICTIGKVSSDELWLISKYHITHFPTVVFFKDGKEVERIVGVKPEKEYSESITYWHNHTPTQEESDPHPLYDISQL
jgi:thioredoxin 1